jgi:DNA-binding GntR family transcriptional regulator
MVTIGTGRDDPRRWVQAAYLLLDTAEGGETGPQGKLPARAEIAAKLGVQKDTVTRAYRDLTARGVIHLVPGCGYFTRMR